MTTNRNTNRLDIYIPLTYKVYLREKANRLGISLSSLLVRAALEYNISIKPAKLGERLEHGTFTVIIDKGEGLFLKSGGTSTVDRSTVKRESE